MQGMHFSPQALRNERKKAGLSETQLAALVELTETAVRHYERGRRVPSINRLAAMAAALGCHIDALLVTEPPRVACMPRIRPTRSVPLNG
jgi:transcriptional regulator with XRE-family HTH domain